VCAVRPHSLPPIRRSVFISKFKSAVQSGIEDAVVVEINAAVLRVVPPLLSAVPTQGTRPFFTLLEKYLCSCRYKYLVQPDGPVSHNIPRRDQLHSYLGKI
jgi:hypothetical protein